MAQARITRTGGLGSRRPRLAAVRFEKWQALGNDYVIVEQPVDAELARALCDRHAGVGADGVLELSPPVEPGFVARLRIFNPDGSEAELSGNGARQAVLYLRRAGWTEQRTFSIETAAGEIRPTILSADTCRLDLGRARLGAEGEAGGFRFQHLTIGNPQTAIALARPEDVEALDLAAVGPPIEHDPRFPNRTNAPPGTPSSPRAASARGSSSAARGRRARAGTGACGAAIAYVVRGGDSPVTVVPRRRRPRGRGGRGLARRAHGLGGPGLRRGVARRRAPLRR